MILPFLYLQFNIDGYISKVNISTCHDVIFNTWRLDSFFVVLISAFTTYLFMNESGECLISYN